MGNEEEHVYRHFGCVKCRRVVTVGAYQADMVAGRSNWGEHTMCGRCAEPMVETDRGDCGHVLLPGENCTCRS